MCGEHGGAAGALALPAQGGRGQERRAGLVEGRYPMAGTAVQAPGGRGGGGGRHTEAAPLLRGGGSSQTPRLL